MDATAYAQQLAALLPPGPLWDALRQPGSVSAELFAAIAEELARIDARMEDLANESDPRTALELLDEWEAWAGLPTDCTAGLERTLQERRSALTSKLTSRTGQSRAYIIARAAELGHDITIDEVRPTESGVMQAGDELVADHADRHWFQVNVPVENTFAFVAGASVAGDELGYWQPLRLECLLNEIKPGHTGIIWNYTVGA